MSDASIKLKEAQFFIELLESLEKRGDSLTNIASPVEEASFLLSAILNSFYSVTEHTKSIIEVDKVQEFKNSFPLFYNGKRGIRNITIHEKHIGIDHEGYKPPVGGAKLSLRPEPKLIQHKAGTAKLSLVSYFYLEVDGEFKHITELCYKHYYELCKFVKNEIG